MLDIIILLLLAWFVINGWRRKLINEIGGLVGVVLGAYFAGQFYQEATVATKIVFSDENMATFAAFAIIFLAIFYLISWAAKMITKITKLVTWLPFLSLGMRITGAIMGFINANLLIGLLLWVHMKYPVSEWVTAEAATSQFAHYVSLTAKLLTPFLPEIIKMAERAIS